jgi:ATP/maltotriose-dependent transcriptional regulator MalT
MTTAPKPGSGLRLRADLALLADVLLQLMEGGFLAPFVVCDDELRVLAATTSTQALVDLAATGGLPHELIDAARALRALPAVRTQSVVVRVRGGHPITVRLHPLRDLGSAAFAMILEKRTANGDEATDSLMRALGCNARERQLVTLLRRGLSNREIAATLRLTEGTVKAYMHELFHRLAVDSRMQLVARIDQLLAEERSA